MLQKVELNSTLFNNFSAHPATERLDLLQDRFGSWVVNEQHRYSTRFAAMLQNKLHVFAVRFTVLLKLEKMAQDFITLFEDEKSRTETSDEANNGCVVEYLIMFILFLSPSCILKRTGWRMSLQVVAMWERFHLAFYRTLESK